MTAKNHYKIEVEGQTLTRNSANVYTHVVVGLQKWAGWSFGDRKLNDDDFPKWTALRWAGSRALAEKALPRFRQYAMFADLKIVEVGQTPADTARDLTPEEERAMYAEMREVFAPRA